jgi:hypothetical protein
LDILDITDELSDFDETAAPIGCLDLVITVDTSVAHLAGGLGCPVWILLSYRADHRWLLDRADSPWYPTARLFRQDERRDYRWVLDQVRSELADVVDGFREGLNHPRILSGASRETRLPIRSVRRNPAGSRPA